MQLVLIDWAIIVAYLVVALAIGVALARRGSRDAEAFFLSGRALPWWLAGTSMVATTFAADTPLAITGIVRTQGISGNWFWWSLVMSAMVWTFFYARLWRRARLVTDAEFIALRYSGRPARVLRLFKACYAAILINGIVMGWVIRGMAKFCDVALGWPDQVAVPVLVGLALFYSMLAGLWGVVVTDVLQFGIAMLGSIFLAVLAVNHFGGLAEMRAAVAQVETAPAGVMNVMPTFAEAGRLAMMTFGVYLSMQWWAGRNADGGEYIGQRMMACRTERDARLATLWYAVAHYVLRPWPWILVALASLAVFPTLEDPELGYPKMMMEFLPDGWRGLMVAALLAAFMSTVDTHLNWGASYVVNDLVKGLMGVELSPRGETWLARGALLLMACVAGVAAFSINSIEWAWKFLVALGAGAGMVTLLRWYWWRINAWSELTAMATSLLIAVYLFNVEPWSDPAYEGVRVMLVVVGSLAVWLPATLLTRPVPQAHLEAFYARVRPQGPGWTRVSGGAGVPGLGRARLGWVGGVVMIYGGLFGLGAWLLGGSAASLGIAIIATISGGVAVLHVLKNDNNDDIESAQ